VAKLLGLTSDKQWMQEMAEEFERRAGEVERRLKRKRRQTLTSLRRPVRRHADHLSSASG